MNWDRQHDRVTVLTASTGARISDHRSPGKTSNTVIAARPGHAGYAVVRRTAEGGSRCR